MAVRRYLVPRLMSWHRPRARLLLVALILFVVALESNTKRLRTNLSRGEGAWGRDEVSLTLQEIESARQQFHIRDAIGFFSDDPRRSKGFALTQYALAPLPVENDTEHSFAIVFSRNAAFVADVVRTRGYVLLSASPRGYSVLRKQ